MKRIYTLMTQAEAEAQLKKDGGVNKIYSLHVEKQLYAFFYQTLNEFGYYYPYSTEAYHIPDWLKKNNFLQVSRTDSLGISYIPLHKLPKEKVEWLTYKHYLPAISNPSSLYREDTEKYRVKAKPGRIFKRLFPTLTDKQIEKMVGKFFALTNPKENKVEISEKVEWTYNEENYYPGKGSLHSSCMRHAPSLSMDFYEGNGVKVARILKDNLVHARAIFWENCEVIDPPKGVPNKISMIDVVYSNNSLLEFVYEKWAKDNGYAYMIKCNTFLWKGKEVVLKLRFPIQKQVDYYSLPYFDTMCYIEGEGEKIVFLNNYKGDCVQNVPEQDEGEIYGYDYITEEALMEDSAVFCEDVGEYCHEDSAVRLYNGNYAHCDDQGIRFSNVTDFYYWENEVITDYEGGVIPMPSIDENTVCLYNDEYAYDGHHHVIILDSGEYAIETDPKVCWDEVNKVYYLEPEQQLKLGNK